MTSILLVEDDRSLGETLSERLAKENYSIQLVTSVNAALDALRKNKFDMAIVDVGLPDGSGFSIAKEAKGRLAIPVIMLTAMGSAEYRLQGFEIGVDDYIPKPFHLKELILRIEKVKKIYINNKAIERNGIKISLDAGSVTLEDGCIQYPNQRDFLLLAELLQRAPQIVSRDEVLNSIWKDTADANARSIDNAVVRLRSLLGKAGERIRSVRGIGYQWVV